MQTTDFLLLIRSLMKFYEQTIGEINFDYTLTPIEIKIITFLHNNPGKDTIGDIAQLRMLPKGNVSQGVESLVQKQLLERTPDKNDRRKAHLAITSKASPLIAEIEKKNKLIQERLYEGFTPKEAALFSNLNARMMENAKKWLSPQ